MQVLDIIGINSLHNIHYLYCIGYACEQLVIVDEHGDRVGGGWGAGPARLMRGVISHPSTHIKFKRLVYAWTVR
jgi:hypothetical protein